MHTPSTMRRGYADTRFGQIHYTSWGRTDAPALVMLPQSANSAAMFFGMAADLQADFRVVVPEYPGSGWSDPLPETVTFGEIADAVVEVLDHLGIRRCVLYGHHTGNKLAAALAAAHPQRVDKLIFVGQSHSIVASNEHRAQTMGKLRRKLLESRDDREAALVQWTDLFNRFNAKWWDESMVRNLDSVERRAATIRKVADEILSGLSMPALYHANFAHDLEGDLRKVQAPTLVIEIVTAAEDRTVGRQGAHLLQIMSNATLETIEEPDRPANTMEHRAADLVRLVRNYLGVPARR